ncbi:MAG: PEP-CTERM sorting domain-containing protein [Akkermansiaceae bacterium]
MKKIKVILSALAISSVSANLAQATVIIVQEDFAGLASEDLAGTTPTIGSGTWIGDTGFKADGSISLGGNSSASLDIGSVINDAKGTANGLFELTTTLAPSGGTWYSIGFGQEAAPNTGAHFLSQNSIGSLILRNTGEIDMWAGNGFTPNGLTAIGNSNAIDGPNEASGLTRTFTIEVDVRTWDGSTDFGTVSYYDSILGALGSFAYTAASATSQGDPVWNSITLSGPNNAAGTYSDLTLTQITVPEPSSTALLGLGSLALILRRRRN